MSVTEITPANSKEFLESNKDNFMVLVFDAEFTGQESTVKTAIESLNQSSELKDKIVIGSVDVEKNNDLTTQFTVLSVPIIACVYKGKAVRKIDNLESAKMITMIQEELKRQNLSESDTSSDPKEKFQNYLKQLINRAPVMIFMKGDPSAPRCGFSRQLVELLGKHDIKYETFDILQDEEVRQGLKEFSEWPTYPQIYAKGEFVGGLDILKQLEETGELEAILKVQ